MRLMKLTLILIVIIMLSCKSKVASTKILKTPRFDIEKDLLLGNFDCKTDVDDLHTVAAFITLLSNSRFSKINYHAVAGTYGIQEGLYVPPNNLFESAFGTNWTDAHKNLDVAIKKVKEIIKNTLINGGDVWIAEAGQSDFSAKLIKATKIDMPNINMLQRVHVVQHSEWNEKVTSAESLQYVKQHVDYHKIPDGNVVGNGSPGFGLPDYNDLKNKIVNPKLLGVWELAIALGNQYNGVEGRYKNSSIHQGGLDFSDLSETCYILGLQDIKDVPHFFELFGD